MEQSEQEQQPGVSVPTGNGDVSVDIIDPIKTVNLSPSKGGASHAAEVTPGLDVDKLSKYDQGVRNRRVPRPRALESVYAREKAGAASTATADTNIIDRTHSATTTALGTGSTVAPSAGKPPLGKDKQKQKPKMKPTNIRQSILVQVVIASLLSGMTLVIIGLAMGLLDQHKWKAGTNMYNADTVDQHRYLQTLNESGKPIVVAMYSTSCLACRRMRKPFTHAAKVLSTEPQLDVACFAADVADKHNSAWIDQYQVRVVPSILFIHGARFVRYQGKPESSPIVAFVRNELKHSL